MAFRPEPAEVLRIIDEAPDVRTLHLRSRIEPEPGNFVMLWVPDGDASDEIPLSISDAGEGYIAITVKAVGPTTNAILDLAMGDKVGMTGPLGNSFEVKGKRILLVGGGVGIAPIHLLARSLSGDRSCTSCQTDGPGDGPEARALVGYPSEGAAMLLEGLSRACPTTVVTEDGSLGLHGLVTDHLHDALISNEIDMYYACGPEPMLVKVAEIAEKAGVPGQISMERLMWCGRGVCGSCLLDGQRTCREGPVFDSERLLSGEDLGRRRLDEYGRWRGP